MVMSKKIALTPEQAKAVNYEGKNILVSAAAGCGKTTLMIQRIIRKIVENKVNIDELVVVTFTEAAAAELKQRLEIALNENLEQDPDFISQQISKLNDAYISTFHSLCLRLLKENGVIFKFDDAIKVADALQIKNLKLKAFKQLENENINNEDYIALRDAYSSLIDSSTFFELLNNTLDICITKGSIEGFLKNAEQPLVIKSIFDYDEYAKVQTEATLTSLNLIINLFENSLDEENTVEFNEKLTSEINFFNSLLHLVYNGDYQAIQEQLASYKIFDKPRVTKTNTFQVIRQNQPIVKDEIEKNLKKLYSLTNDEYVYIIKTNQNNVALLLKYVQKYQAILKKLKKETGILEYNDLEQEALDLLYDNNSESMIALQLKTKFNEIMIDEYQDTNIIQEKIVKALANGSNTFMVGDLKQAIYRFRNATPQLFVDKYELYQTEEMGIVIDLSYNFRSKNEVLDTTNFIFKSVFSKNVGGINYDQKNQLNFGNTELNEVAGDFKTRLFFNIIPTEEKSNVDQKYYASAKAIVNEIKNLLNNGVKCNDITILFRQRNRSFLLTNILNQENIPYMIHDNSGFYTSYEIRDLINILKVLTNPDDDIALLSILRSYFCNLNEADLLELALLEGNSYYQKLNNSTYTDTLNLLNDLIYFAKDNTPLTIINYIYEKTDYLAYLQKHTNYEQILMNINTFKKIISEGLDYYNSLEYLINELDSSIASNFDTARPATLSEKEDVINIMTIHKSKGLEFKYVFFFDESDVKFDKGQNATNIRAYQTNLILPFFDLKQRIKAANPLNRLLDFVNKKEILAEELRVLYVALTRAQLQLNLFTNINESRLLELQSLMRNENDWLISESVMMNMKKIFDAITLSFMRHKSGLKLRESMPLNCYDEIYKYKDNLFEVNNYDYSLLNKDDNLNSYHNYPIKQVAKALVEIKGNEKLTPSKHQTEMLDFSNIKEFDTFKQGTLVHKVFELLDFKSPTILEDLAYLVKEYNIYQKNYDGLKAFFNSDYFKIFRNSDVHKEYSFSLMNDGSITNGIIDLYIETVDEVYIVDYKSDNLSIEELKLNYQKQLLIYQDIVSKRTTKKSICLIYSLHNKDFIEIKSS